MSEEPAPQQTHRCPECGNPLVKAEPTGNWTCLRCGSFDESLDSTEPA